MRRDSKTEGESDEVKNTEIVRGVIFSFYSEVTLIFRLTVRVIPARLVESRVCLSPLILTAERRDVYAHHT